MPKVLSFLIASLVAAIIIVSLLLFFAWLLWRWAIDTWGDNDAAGWVIVVFGICGTPFALVFALCAGILAARVLYRRLRSWRLNSDVE